MELEFVRLGPGLDGPGAWRLENRSSNGRALANVLNFYAMHLCIFQIQLDHSSHEVTKHGRYLRKMDKRGIGTLSFVRASSLSEPVIMGLTRGRKSGSWSPILINWFHEIL